MKSACILVTLLASAAAFAPASQHAATKTSLSAFEDELGAQPPLGFFDPIGLVENADQRRFDRLRYIEIKHGRVCMLAFLGNIVTRYGAHLPGAIDKAGDQFDSYPNGLAAFFGPESIPLIGFGQIFFFIGFLELAIMKDIPDKGNEFIGDFRNGSLDFGWDTFDDDTKLQKRAIELNNGRAAMLGILGLMIHEELGGSLPIVGQM